MGDYLVSPPFSFSFRHEGAITSVGGESLFEPSRGATMSAGSPTCGSGWYKRGSDRRGGLSFPSDIRLSADSGSSAESTADTGGTFLDSLRHTDLRKQDTHRGGHIVIPYRGGQRLRIYSILDLPTYWHRLFARAHTFIMDTTWAFLLMLHHNRHNLSLIGPPPHIILSPSTLTPTYRHGTHA